MYVFPTNLYKMGEEGSRTVRFWLKFRKFCFSAKNGTKKATCWYKFWRKYNFQKFGNIFSQKVEINS